MLQLSSLPSPKLDRKRDREWSALFHYYAGFSSSFAARVIERHYAGGTIFDPWNGAGTTTATARKIGLPSEGSDINPVMQVIARARSAPRHVADLVPDLLSPQHMFATPDDPLLEWFEPEAATTVRQLGSSIAHIAGNSILSGASNEDIKCVKALMQVALFSVCNILGSHLRTSNPTWRKKSKEDERLSTNYDEFMVLYGHALQAARNYVTIQDTDSDTVCPLLSTRAAHLKPNIKPSLIVTSPPYCTRIDYAHLTRLELAVLAPGMLKQFARFRRTFTGTSLSQQDMGSIGGLPKATQSFLEEIKCHTSRASSGYYYNTHLDYFLKMNRSLRAVGRNLNSGGAFILVVQDSWYKDLHNDVPYHLQLMLESVSLNLEDRLNFPISRSLADVHRHRSAYLPIRQITEDILIMRKA